MARLKRAAAQDAGPKRRKGMPLADFLKNTLSTLELLSSGDRLLTGAFLKLPSRKMYPDYYLIIAEPILLAEIHKKVVRGQYDGAQQFALDFRLMHENASRYNDPGLWIVLDAKKILDFVEAQAEQYSLGLGAIVLADLPRLCLDILNEVVEHEFGSEGALSGPFMDVVDRDEYPDYYKVISKPTSFNSVKADIAGLLFDVPTLEAGLQAFYQAVLLIFVNAQTYNDLLLLIHEDLKRLQLLFEEKFAELKTEALPNVKLTLRPPKEPVRLTLSLKDKKKKPKKEREVKEDDRTRSLRLNAVEYAVLGKDVPQPLASVFVTRVVFSLALANTQLAASQLVAKAKSPAGAVEKWARAFAPGAVPTALAAFEYQFQPEGHTTKTYAVLLPADAQPHVLLRVALHELLHAVKRSDLALGRAALRPDDLFSCALYLNDEEVRGAPELGELHEGRTRALVVLYDAKLSYGLNCLLFQLRLAPQLTHKVRQPPAGQDPLWEVEKFQLYVSCHTS